MIHEDEQWPSLWQRAIEDRARRALQNIQPLVYGLYMIDYRKSANR